MRLAGLGMTDSAALVSGACCVYTSSEGVTMRILVLLGLCLMLSSLRTSHAAGPVPPTLDEVRREMGIPSKGDLRGQKDAVGFASTAAQMAEAWNASSAGPAPESLGNVPADSAWGVICPHDDFLYAGRVYRSVIPTVKAKRVIVLGVFHGWKKFGAREVLVFDDYRAWRTPDGELKVSSLREALLSRLPKGDVVQSDAMHDSEHSVEAVSYWLKHQNPDLEIVPILVSTMSFERMQDLSARLAEAISAEMKARGWNMGKDLAVVISSDAVHYGPDFKFTPYGDGGVEAYMKACAADRALLTGPLAGVVTTDSIRRAFETFCDPKDPGQYRLTWCGRFSIPFGLLTLERLAASQDRKLEGRPVAYATSVGWPQLAVKAEGMGLTAPSNLYHFVGYPAAVYTVK